MVRFLMFAVVVGVAFTLYAIIDVAMSDASRSRGVTKPVWVLLTVILPVIGGILWFTLGKGRPGAGRPAASTVTSPDDDPRFSGSRISDEDLDAHMRDLEARLKELDDEKFPGEEGPADGSADPADGSSDSSDGPADPPSGSPSA